jgi:hypothetical protein
MGVVRCPVECPGCKGKITLRLGVGMDARQPFFYVCGDCKAATKGALLLDSTKEGPTTEVELEAGHILDSFDGCTQTIHLNPEIPSVADAPDFSHPGGSAFIFHFQNLGPERMQFWEHQVQEFEHFVRNGWPALKRLTAYYLNSDWPRFDKAVPELVEGMPEIKEQWRREDVIHQLYDHAFLVLLALGPPHYPEMKLEWNALWDSTRPNWRAMTAFAAREAGTGGFHQLQRDVFHLLEQFTDLRRTLAAGFLLDMYPPGKEKERDGLRMFRDDFPMLRDFYIQAFEKCHRGLRYVIGAVNAEARGNENAFPAWPSKPFSRPDKVLKNLDEFEKLVNANKRLWLKTLPKWDNVWDEFFDRSFRNDIGHASVRHQLSDGVLVRDDDPPQPYLDFVRRAARVGNPILMLLNVLKILCIYANPGATP